MPNPRKRPAQKRSARLAPSWTTREVWQLRLDRFCAKFAPVLDSLRADLDKLSTEKLRELLEDSYRAADNNCPSALFVAAGLMRYEIELILQARRQFTQDEAETS